MLTVRVEAVDESCFDTQSCMLRLKGRNIEENQHVKLGAFRARGSFYTAVLKVDFRSYSRERFYVARCSEHLCLRGGCGGCS